MKRSLLYGMLALVLMGAAACRKANDGKSSQPLYPCNDADYLLHRVLEVDSNGAIVGTLGGLQLDESDPGKVAAVAESYEEAKAWFSNLVPDYATVITNDNHIIWNLRDTSGVAQGQAVLKAVSGSPDGRIAELEVPVSARPLSGIVFIPRDAMPLNDDELDDRESCEALDNFYLGALITVDDGRLPKGAVMLDGFTRGRGAFIVIQEYSPGANYGYLLHLEPGEQDITSIYVDDSKHFNRASFSWTLENVRKILKANPSLHSNLSAMQMVSWDHWFMCRRNNADSKRYRYHLKEGGDLERLYLFGSWYYYEAFVYKFEVRASSRFSDGYGVFISGIN